MTVFLMISFGAIALVGALMPSIELSLVSVGLTACAALVHSANLISESRVRAAEIQAEAAREREARERQDSVLNEIQDFRRNKNQRPAG